MGCRYGAIDEIPRQVARLRMTRTHYAKNGDTHIAYQVHGNGPLDLVLCDGATTHLDVLWEEPGYRRYCEELASFTRLIRFDKRGTDPCGRSSLSEADVQRFA